MTKSRTKSGTSIVVGKATIVQAQFVHNKLIVSTLQKGSCRLPFAYLMRKSLEEDQPVISTIYPDSDGILDEDTTFSEDGISHNNTMDIPLDDLISCVQTKMIMNMAKK